MTFRISCLAMLAVAGSATAAPFSVSSVDFGLGNAGAGLTVTGGTISFNTPTDTYLGLGITGVAIADNNFDESTPTFMPGSPGFSLGGFEGGYFMESPVANGLTPDGREGVFLMSLIGDFTDMSVTSVDIEITDANGTSTVNFSGFDVPSGGYELVTYSAYDRTVGGKQIWVASVPTPGTAGILGLAGFAATRRRR